MLSRFLSIRCTPLHPNERNVEIVIITRGAGNQPVSQCMLTQALSVLHAKLSVSACSLLHQPVKFVAVALVELEELFAVTADDKGRVDAELYQRLIHIPLWHEKRGAGAVRFTDCGIMAV